MNAWKMAHVIPSPSRPGQMEGPLRRKRAAKKPARLCLFLLKQATVKIKKAIAKMGLAACLDSVVRPGSRAMKKARIKPGRGLRRFSSNKRGAKTRRLPIMAGMRRARISVPLPYRKKRMAVERM